VVYKVKRRLLKKTIFPMTSREQYRDFSTGALVGEIVSTSAITLHSWQITGSEGHRWPEGRSERDVGGPFETVKSDFDISYSKEDYHLALQVTGIKSLDYRGKVIIHHPDNDLTPWNIQNPEIYDLSYPASRGTFGSDLTQKGTNFISQTVPTNPTVDGSVGLAELFREGIPSMIGSSLLQSRIGFLRGLGSEYLNFEFGWKPLVSDVKNAAKAIMESETILNQLVRDSGKNVHRKRHLLPTKEVSTSISSIGWPNGLATSDLWGPSWARCTDDYRRDTWFSGCYTFEYDPGNLFEISRIATQARLLYGLQLTPEVLWNLAPWSWLVDWFANVGPLLHNVSAFQNDQLVLRYGYVMDRHRRTYTQVTNCTPLPRNTFPARYKEVYSLDWKRRQQATPFGFGIASSSFTIRQWAILAALGITRGPSIP